VSKKDWRQAYIVTNRRRRIGDKPQRQRGVEPGKAKRPFLSAARRPDGCKRWLTSRNATERKASQEGRPVFAIAKMPQRIKKRPLMRTIYPQISLFRGQIEGPHAQYVDKSCCFDFKTLATF